MTDGDVVVTASVQQRHGSLPTTRASRGNHIFIVSVEMRNTGNNEETVNPFDFELRDPNGQEHRVMFSIDRECEFNAVDLAPGGAISGNLCFDASGNADSLHTLIWTHGLSTEETGL